MSIKPEGATGQLQTVLEMIQWKRKGPPRLAFSYDIVDFVTRGTTINYSGLLKYFHLGAERKGEWSETGKRKD